MTTRYEIWEPSHKPRPFLRGFTLLETLTALGILSLMCTGVVVVMNRCAETATNLTLQMQAFEVAREQMEQVLTKPLIRESVELGTSEQYPSVQWQTTIETFDGPVDGSTWARAVCSSQYEDADGTTQTVELTCWLNRLTADQLAKLDQQKTPGADDQLLEGVEAAADYAGVTVETIQGWLANGLVVTEDGAFIKVNLDLYKRTDGRPSDKDRQQQIRSPDELQSQDRDTSQKSGAGPEDAAGGPETPATSGPLKTSGQVGTQTVDRGRREVE